MSERSNNLIFSNLALLLYKYFMHYIGLSMHSGAHPANFKGGVKKKPRSRTQERIQRILEGGGEILNKVDVN